MKASVARVLVVCAAAAALFAPPASARFVPITSPAPFQLFAASGDDWLGVTQDFPLRALVSRDGGATWQQVPLNGVGEPGDAAGLSVGPDHGFYMTVRDQDGAPALLRMAAGGASFERLPAALPSEFSALAGAPAWDDSGRMWIGFTDQDLLTVERLAPDGSAAQSVTAKATAYADPAIEFAGGKLYADVGSGVWQLVAGTLRQISGAGTKTFGNNWPVLAAGRTVVTRSGLSLDDGATFADRIGGSLLAVHGNPKLLVMQGFGGDDGGRIMRRWSPAVYRPTGLTVPNGAETVWQTRRGLVVFSSGNAAGLSLHAGAVPGLAVSSRGMSRTARAMLATANRYRRAAGLPPFLGDRLISKASLNHARYWSGRSLPRGHLLDVHGETPRTRGFTGRSPQERCRHVGGDCGGEVMNFGNQAQRPVDSWMATPYHRQPFIDPSGVAAGAARVGSIAVMDFSIAPQNLAIAPVKFPSGRYRGPLAFPGNEAPDPLAACRGVHQPLGPAPSVPVSFVPPVGIAAPVEVRLYRGRARVPGCTKAGFFMGRSPLRRGTRYTAKAMWRPVGGRATVTTVWRFRT